MTDVEKFSSNASLTLLVAEFIEQFVHLKLKNVA